MRLTTKLLKEMIREELKETAFGGKEKYMAKHVAPDQMIPPEDKAKLLSSLKWTIDNADYDYQVDLDPTGVGLEDEEKWEELYHYDENLKMYPKAGVLPVWIQAYKEVYG